MLTFVQQGKLTLDQLVALMHTNPRRIFNLPEQPDTHVEVDLDEEWVIPHAPAHSRCGWTPFAGVRVRGVVRRVVLRGEIVFLDGKVLGRAGSGHDVRKVDGGVATAAEATVDTKRPPESPAKPVAVKKPVLVRFILIVLKVSFIYTLFFKTPTKFELQPAAKPLSFPLQPLDKEVVGSFPGKHILKVSQFSRKDLHYIFTVAHEMRTTTKKSGSIELLKVYKCSQKQSGRKFLLVLVTEKPSIGQDSGRAVL